VAVGNQEFNWYGGLLDSGDCRGAILYSSVK
jgi:hypothetical protein